MREEDGTYSRPTFDEWGLTLALAISTRGDCRRSQVGAVILDQNHRIIGAGYNGAAVGAPGCMEGHCPRGHFSHDEIPPGTPYSAGDQAHCIALHAEINALIDAGRHRLHNGCVLYCTREPCADCEKIVSGYLIRIVWGKPDSKWIMSAFKTM